MRKIELFVKPVIIKIKEKTIISHHPPPPQKKINDSYQQPNIENINNKNKLKFNNYNEKNPNVLTFQKPSSCRYRPKQRGQSLLHAQNT